jgi:hypothetical protein
MYAFYVQLASYKMFMLKVDAMLHKLEKEIDDVDAKIGDRWRLLDKFVAL